MARLAIRLARRDDAAAVNRIYNYYVARTTATFDIDAWDLQRRQTWLDQFAADNHPNNSPDNDDGQTPYRAWVAQVDNGGDDGIIGFAYISAFRQRPAYRRACETTIYIDPNHHRRGAGDALYRALFAHIAETKLHRAYAVIALPNPASIALHQKFGFAQVAILNQVGYKFGRYVDVAWLEKKLRTRL